MTGFEVFTIFLGVAGIVVPAFLAVLMNGVKSTQRDMVNQLSAIEEKGILRGQHLEEKIIDIKVSVSEAIRDVKDDFGELKQDVAQRQLMDEGIKQELLKELHEVSIKLRVIEKDLGIVQGLYDKRIEHEGEVLDKVNSLEYEVKSLQKKLRKLDNDQKEQKELLRQNGINEARD